jgi:hypothetical protein
MTATTSPRLGQIHALLAERGYEVSEPAPDTLRIQDTHSGISLQAVLQGDVLFLSLTCTVVARTALTLDIAARMLAADNGISTSHFQLYDAGQDRVAVTLANFCKLQDLGPDNQDEILSCVHFLLVDVIAARGLLSEFSA